MSGVFVFSSLPIRSAFLWFFFALLASGCALAGGPKYVAGVGYFNPGVVGQPIHWAGGKVNYYVDRGPLNSSVTNKEATAMVDAAAKLWSAIPTAGVALADKGPLNEDVDGSTIGVSDGVITRPSDVTPDATKYPVGVIYDASGAVIDKLFGAGASEPASCEDNGVLVWLDNIEPDATIRHGIIVLNGLCATNAGLLAMMSYELERAFGRILNLDYAQVNPGALENGEVGGTLGWPVMQPLSGLCGPHGGACIPLPSQLHWDDIAAVSRIYPVTAQNRNSFPGKLITASKTVSIKGKITFRAGTGMQGVNVVARPIDASGNPLYEYTVSFVSGAYFNGNHGSPVTGFDDSSGNPLAMWGSNEAAVQGAFDLSAMPLPPGMKSASYEITFEALNPLYILEDSVGPYIDGSPEPSGIQKTVVVADLEAGSAHVLDVNVADSAVAGGHDPIGTQAKPRELAAAGSWTGRLSEVGQSDWLSFPVLGGRTFTIVTQALDSRGVPTEQKAMPALGVWDSFLPINTPAVGVGPGLNGYATGETWLRVTASGDDTVRLGIADQRGDGRPDYAYEGWVLYAGTVSPASLPQAGGRIVIEGMGFRKGDTVLVAGRAAKVVSIAANQIVAVAPAAGKGVKGVVDVEVDDQPIFYAAAIIYGGLRYE
jgi:hypothetical protein